MPVCLASTLYFFSFQKKKGRRDLCFHDGKKRSPQPQMRNHVLFEPFFALLISDRMESHYPLLFNNYRNESQLEMSSLTTFVHKATQHEIILKALPAMAICDSLAIFKLCFQVVSHRPTLVFHNDECSLCYPRKKRAAKRKKVNKKGKSIKLSFH